LENNEGKLESSEVSKVKFKKTSKNRKDSTILILGSTGTVRKFRISLSFLRNVGIFFIVFIIISIFVINDYLKLKKEIHEQSVKLKKAEAELYESRIELKKSHQHISLLKDYVSSLEKRIEEKQFPETIKDEFKVLSMTEEAQVQEQSTPSVDVQDMVIQKEGSKVTVDFKIVNIKEGNEPVGGYIHIIAKREGNGAVRNWTYPDEELVNGVPANYRKGQPFLIQRFKPIHGRFHIAPGSKHPTVIIILVYNHTGQVILKREFEVGSVS
jgi:hypothetical protein